MNAPEEMFLCLLTNNTQHRVSAWRGFVPAAVSVVALKNARKTSSHVYTCLSEQCLCLCPHI